MKKPQHLATVKTESVFVTPAMADAWLGKNKRNRTISNQAVNQYCRALKSGDWPYTHQGIAIDVNGDLLDGQHRLWAISITQCGVWMMVTTGLPPDTMLYVDGGRSRSVGNQLQVQLGISNANRLAAVCKSVAGFCAPWAQKLTVVETNEILSLLSKEIRLYSELSAASRPKIMHSAPVAILSFVHCAKPHECEVFARQLYFSEGLKRDQPAYLLRNFLSGNNARSGSNRMDIFARVTASALRAHIEGRTLSKLYASDIAIDQIVKLNEVTRRKIAKLFPRFQLSAMEAAKKAA